MEIGGANISKNEGFFMSLINDWLLDGSYACRDDGEEEDVYKMVNYILMSCRNDTLWKINDCDKVFFNKIISHKICVFLFLFIITHGSLLHYICIAWVEILQWRCEQCQTERKWQSCQSYNHGGKERNAILIQY